MNHVANFIKQVQQMLGERLFMGIWRILMKYLLRTSDSSKKVLPTIFLDLKSILRELMVAM